MTTKFYLSKTSIEADIDLAYRDALAAAERAAARGASDRVEFWQQRAARLRHAARILAYATARDPAARWNALGLPDRPRRRVGRLPPSAKDRARIQRVIDGGGERV
jgi:hypothetical protein